jgi:protein dithiol:quinone oxidoreductase
MVPVVGGVAVRRRHINVLGALACAAMMGFALFAQFGLHLQPCNMCYLQRVAVIGLGLVFLAAALHDPAALGARLYAVLIALAAAAGIATAARHIWISMQPPGSLPSCGADFYTMLEMLPVRQVVTRIWNGGGECQLVPWRLMGLSMQTWVLIGAAGLGLAGVVGNLGLERAASRPA